jgi:Ribbon-helix-helix domain
MTQVNARIDKEIYDRLSEYSEITGVPVSRCIAEACERWLTEVAPTRVEAMQRSSVVFNENGVGGPFLASGPQFDDDLIAQVERRKKGEL